jgi:hypothetical protein
MRRVTKPGGTIVILNHFRSRNPLMRRIEDAPPVCAHLAGRPTGSWIPPEDRRPRAEVVRRVNMLRGWCLVKVISPAPNAGRRLSATRIFRLARRCGLPSRPPRRR